MNRQQLSISVIIPIYNGAGYLTQCFQTLSEQVYENWEAIFVNDGSTDSSLSILQTLSSKDPRIKIYNQKNQGAAKARETGITQAKGDFVTFLDVDDTIPPDYLSGMMERFTADTDIVATGFNTVNDGQVTKQRVFGNTILSRTEYLKKVLTGKYGWELWGKIYRKRLFDHPIQTPESIRIGEDAAVFLQLVSHARRVQVIDKPLYNYIQYQKSASHVQSTKYAEETLQAGFFIESVLKEYDFYPEIKKEIDSMFLLLYSNSTRKAYLGKTHPLVQEILKKHFTLKALRLLPIYKSIYIISYRFVGKYINKFLFR